MKHNDSLLHEALAINRIGCLEWNLQSRLLTCTGEVYHLFGLDATTTEKGYQPFLTLVHEKDLPLLTQAFRQALQDRKLTSVDFRITRPDGTLCTLEASGRIREDENGIVVKLIGTLQDISARKEAQQELLISERQYRFIAEAVPAMIWTGYGEDKKEYVNTWMVNYTGLPAEKLLGDGWLEVVHPHDRETVVAAQARALPRFEPYHLELRFRRADGLYRWHIMHALPYQDAEGKMTKYIGINADIHEQKLKEEALKENEALREAQQKLRAEKEFSEAILENSLSGLLAFDSGGRITRWNKQMEFLSGSKREQVIGKTLLEVFPEYAQREVEKAIRQALTGEGVTLRNQNNPFGVKEGLYEINLLPLLLEGKMAGGLGVIYEVTEVIKLQQQQADLKLERQKEVLNTILAAQEKERERIGESLHNGIGQLLFAARLNLQSVSLRTMQGESQTTLTKVNELLNEAIRQSRSVSFELVPPTLKDFGLKATLEDLAQTLSSPALTILVEVKGVERRLEKFLELTIFRFIQALVSNVIEHSGAKKAMVKVSTSKNKLAIVVSDNGKGFDPGTATATVQENSVQTVSKRVALLNGKLTIDSRIGKGTKVIIVLPLPNL